MEHAMFWLTLVRDLIKILRAGQAPWQVAGGFALGTVLGLSPMLTLQGMVVWLIILVLNVNLTAVLLAITLCTFVAYLLDPFFHWLGYQILVNVHFLRGIWTYLYNAPLAPLTRFNNTVVMGSLVFALVAFVPVVWGMRRLLLAYRARLGTRLERWKIYQILKRSAMVRWYEKLRDLGG
jgi:uncharacterized protein (TIGR03546 family)